MSSLRMQVMPEAGGSWRQRSMNSPLLEGASRIAHDRGAGINVANDDRAHPHARLMPNPLLLPNHCAGADVGASCNRDEAADDCTRRDHRKVVQDTIVPDDATGAELHVVADSDVSRDRGAVINIDAVSQLRPRRYRRAGMDQCGEPFQFNVAASNNLRTISVALIAA